MLPVCLACCRPCCLPTSSPARCDRVELVSQRLDLIPAFLQFKMSLALMLSPGLPIHSRVDAPLLLVVTAAPAPRLPRGQRSHAIRRKGKGGEPFAARAKDLRLLLQDEGGAPATQIAREVSHPLQWQERCTTHPEGEGGTLSTLWAKEPYWLLYQDKGLKLLITRVKETCYPS